MVHTSRLPQSSSSQTTVPSGVVVVLKVETYNQQKLNCGQGLLQDGCRTPAAIAANRAAMGKHEVKVFAWDAGSLSLGSDGSEERLGSGFPQT